MTAYPSYSTGTVAVAANATTIVGTSTIWSGVNVRSGDDIVIAGNTVTVVDVTDTTHLVIDPWPYAAVAAGAAYKVYQRSPFRFAGGQAMADVSAVMAALNTDGFYVFVSSALTVPDPSYGNNGQYAFQASTGKLWSKSAGVWNFLGVYKGFGVPAPWSSTTAYNQFDVATLAGSSYVCILAHTNFTPPNATYWSVLASIGNTGPQGIQGAGYACTSATSFTIGAGSMAFTTQAGLAWLPGARARISSLAGGGANYMEGVVTAYSGTTLTVNVSKVVGSGTDADWQISLAGDPGSGDLLSTNNLSDLANKKTALDNLSVHGADIASAATINLDTATGNFVHVTGTTSITAITLTDGRQRTVYFTGALTLTNGASLVLPGGANITTAAGDIAVFVADGTTIRCSDYLPATSANYRSLIGAVGVVRFQKFTTSGTYTPDPNLICSDLYAIGAGAGGGGTAGATGQLNGSNGGGGGNTSKKTVTAATVGVSQAVTIGAGGAGGSSAGGAGGGGGDSSVGALCIGKGGSGASGGSNGTIGGAGGVTGTGDISVPGQPGGGGFILASTSGNWASGAGGNASLGFGSGAAGIAGLNAAFTGNAGGLYGGGGSGGLAGNTATGAAGGAGANGLVYIVEYCSK